MKLGVTTLTYHPDFALEKEPYPLRGGDPSNCAANVSIVRFCDFFVIPKASPAI